MSYILDALRKSDQQRQRGATPTLMTVQVTTEEMRKPGLLAYGLIAVLMAVSGGVIGWLRPWQEPSLPAIESVAKPGAVHANVPFAVSPATPGRPSDLPALSRPRLPEPVMKPQQLQPVQKPERTVPATPRKSMSPELPTPPPAPVVSTPPKAVVAARQEAPPPPPATESTADAGVPEVVQVRGVVALSELPLAIQREIPSMSVQVHAYSDTPEERMVGINDLLLKEGDQLAPGLKLEQITPDGMVFSYRQYHFRHGVQ